MEARNESRDGAISSKRNTLRLVEESSAAGIKDIFVGQVSNAAQRMRADIQRVARHPYNVLITGETGTGKTQMARQIHRLSVRSDAPFIELNCANLPDQLVEAELFGHRKGAFTGADQDRKGLFEEADGGILFLDEIGDIPLTVQNRLLKAIDEKQIKRLGTNHYRFCDVQIIAATSRSLARMVQDREFREDLFCRLAVLSVETTPLRERREDIPAMIANFLREATDAVGCPTNKHEQYRIDQDALALLSEADYPGNIRALRNLIFELTSYVDHGEPISLQLVQSALARSISRVNGYLCGSDAEGLTHNAENARPSISPVSQSSRTIDPASQQSFFHSIARGDIILPLELCVLRRGETFKQWTARAKRCTIEATRQTTGGTMQTVADRLGLTLSSLKSHLQRAKRAQNEDLFDWRQESG